MAGDAEGVGTQRSASASAAMARHRPSTRRVSRGSMMPSSHRRAVPNSAVDSLSSRALSAIADIALPAFVVDGWPARSILPRLTMSITLAACAPPITAVCAPRARRR